MLHGRRLQRDLNAKSSYYRNCEKHQASVDQVILQWHLNRNTIIFPKSITSSRIEENSRLSYFQLDASDMEKLIA